MSLSLWSVEGLRVGADGFLDAPQSPLLLLLYHFYIIPVNPMVWGVHLPSERRLAVTAYRLPPLTPCVGPALSNVGHLNSVVSESDTQESSSHPQTCQYPGRSAGAVCRIGYKNCPMTYIGKTIHIYVSFITIFLSFLLWWALNSEHKIPLKWLL